MLEELFCITAATVREAYNGMRADSDGHISAADFGDGLQKCGLPAIDENTLEKIMGAVAVTHDGSIQLGEFESAISKLMLSRLLDTYMLYPIPARSESDNRKKLIVTDYNNEGTSSEDIVQSNLCEFFFGRRSLEDRPVTRWIH